MNIFSFAVHFGSEEACRYHFKEQRDKEGVTCKKCGKTEKETLEGLASFFASA